MSEDDIEKSQAPLLDHLIELRQRLIYCVIGFVIALIACFFIAQDIFNLLLWPYRWALGDDTNIRLIYTAPQEYFFTQLKIAMFGGLFIAFPLIAIQIYKFVAPGLYRNERNAFRPYLVATPILFMLGAALVFFFVMPVALRFFASFQQSGTEGQAIIELLPRVSEYLSLIMTLILAFGICFQLPIILTLLGQIGVVSSEQLRSGRKFAIVGVFVIAAVFTPPDPFSQVGLALPLLGLYELAVWSVRWIEKRRDAARAAEASQGA
ncbi:MAG TPA: twin-arginine translocase subunit TatC [Aestuariivirgaceae bacterium]|jgi:sec-independent protein translocase protein TatC